jgi:tRNA dimethylallyltransferase
LEIFEVSGRRPSEVRGIRWTRRNDGPFFFLGLSRPRRSLYRRIEERIDSMMKGGFLEEVEFLMSRFSSDCKPFRGLGYKHMVEYLQGRCEFEEAVSRWKRDTRRYAKRQITWFSRDERVHWVSLEGDREEVWRTIHSLVEANLS